MNRDHIIHGRALALTFFDDAILHTAGQRDDAVFGFVFVQELFGPNLILFSQGFKLSHALFADALLQGHHALAHLFNLNGRLVAVVGRSNGGVDRFQINIDVIALQLGTKLIANRIAQTLFF